MPTGWKSCTCFQRAAAHPGARAHRLRQTHQVADEYPAAGRRGRMVHLRPARHGHRGARDPDRARRTPSAFTWSCSTVRRPGDPSYAGATVTFTLSGQRAIFDLVPGDSILKALAAAMRRMRAWAHAAPAEPN